MDDVLRVVCLCAAWCGVCRDYAAVFDDAALVFGTQAEFTRIDIEDDAELVSDVDVENFPTLLITRGAQPLFFGTVTPHTQTLARLVQGALAGELNLPAAAPEVAALAQQMHGQIGRAHV